MSQSAWRDYHLSDPLVEDMLCAEASAGTGKTYTIEGMVARLIAQDGVLIDRLLVVTFTVAATAELKTRPKRSCISFARRLSEARPRTKTTSSSGSCSGARR